MDITHRLYPTDRLQIASVMRKFDYKTYCVTIDLFQERFLDFNQKIKFQNRKVLFLIDKTGGHKTSFKFKSKSNYVSHYYLTTDTTSFIQLCVQGIKCNFKVFNLGLLCKLYIKIIDEIDELVMPVFNQTKFFYNGSLGLV